MGIKFFWRFFNRRYSQHITRLKKNIKLRQKNTKIDTFCIDLNGIVHPKAQIIYNYGEKKSQKNIYSNLTIAQKELECFKLILNEIEKLIRIVEPRKQLLLVLDGVAPISKQKQQRSRRYKNSLDIDEKNDFDSNCISPGTMFMDKLSKYLDFYIRIMIQKNTKINIIFSSEKSISEGEHKIFNFIRKHGKKNWNYLIHGLDADLILLSMTISNEMNIKILREDLFNDFNEYFLIDISNLKKEIIETQKIIKNDELFDESLQILDFILIISLVGNDFIPNIYTIGILNNGLELLFNIYVDIYKKYGNLTNKTAISVNINNKNFYHFCFAISQLEEKLIDEKYKNRDKYFEDKLLIKYFKLKNKKIEKLKNLYYSSKFLKENNRRPSIKKISNEYLKTLEWILTYYNNGESDWNYSYSYNYGPFCSDILKYILKYKNNNFNKISRPTTPFEQLLYILPKTSKDLLPYQLSTLMTNDKCELYKYFPEKFDIDLSGKKFEWEGIVILEKMNLNILSKCFRKIENKINTRDLKRNKREKSCVYMFSKNLEYEYSMNNYKISNCKIKKYFIEF